MRGMIARYNAGCLVLCVVTLAASNVFAGSSIKKEWQACEKNDDCTSVEQCGGWLPINKIYIKEMMAVIDHTPCDRTPIPSPQPTTSCVNHQCVKDPYTGKFWQLFRIDLKGSLIRHRVDLCRETLKTNVSVDDSRYIQKIDDLILRDPSSANKPLDQIITSVIPCEEIAAEAQKLEKK